MDYSIIVIIILLFFLYIYERKKENFNLLEEITPYIKLNSNKKVTIISMFSPENYEYEKLCIQNYKRYVQLHDIGLYIYKIQDNLSDFEKSYYKIQIINSILELNQHSYIIWMDLNYCFNNNLYVIQKYISINEADIICINNDSNNKYSYTSTFMIFKNTDWTKNIINKTLNYKNKNKVSYNQILKQIISKSLVSKKSNNSSIYNNDFINSYPIILKEYNSLSKIEKLKSYDNYIQNLKNLNLIFYDQLKNKNLNNDQKIKELDSILNNLNNNINNKNLNTNLYILPYNSVYSIPSKRTIQNDHILDISILPIDLKIKFINQINEKNNII